MQESVVLQHARCWYVDTTSKSHTDGAPIGCTLDRAYGHHQEKLLVVASGEQVMQLHELLAASGKAREGSKQCHIHLFGDQGQCGLPYQWARASWLVQGGTTVNI